MVGGSTQATQEGRNKPKDSGGLRPVKGWAFFTLSRECAEYASEFIRHNPRYVRFFKHTHFADEYFWHTILLNSPFKNKIANTNLQYARYIPPTGRGATFGKENLDELKSAPQITSSPRSSTLQWMRTFWIW